MAITNSTKKIKKEIADGIENVLEVFEVKPTIAKIQVEIPFEKSR